MSDVEKNPRAEVIEETSETLDVLRLDKTPRTIKMDRERALYAGAAEVQLSERSVTLQDGIDTVRARVDALQPVKRALPEARPPPPAPVLEPEPEPEVPEAKLTKSERAAVEKLVPGQLVRIDTIYETKAGQAVEATYEEGGKTRRRAYLVRDGAAADLDELGRVLDEIPTPTVEEEIEDEPEETAAPAVESETATEEPAADPTAEPTAQPAAEEPAGEEPASRKRRFSFGKKKADDAPPAKSEPAAAKPEASDAPAADEPPKKRRFGLGRK